MEFEFPFPKQSSAAAANAVSPLAGHILSEAYGAPAQAV